MTVTDQTAPETKDAPDPEAELETLLDYLKRTRRVDFTGYKRPSLLRRAQKRMQAVGAESYTDYLDYLEVHPDEFIHLFNTVLINVTAFFRDPLPWEMLAQDILPRMLAAKPSDEPIRVWSAGCASGEEVYTLAILLAEALGPEKFRGRVKIYGTDIDEEALSQARQAAYTPREVAGLSPALLEKYFELSGGRFLVHKDLRRAAIFGRHDLIQDAPISRIDLLSCRNTLMYFHAEVQARVLAHLHFALRDGGCLLLGKADGLFAHTGLFTAIDLKRRIFSRAPRAGYRDRPPAQTQPAAEASQAPSGRLGEAAFEMGPSAQFLVDGDGLLALMNEKARALFRVGFQDLGRPLQDLEISYRPLEMRSLIEQASAERRPVHLKSIAWPPQDKTGFYDVQVAPAIQNGDLLGVLVTFTDVSQSHALQEQLDDAGRELEAAYEELQATSEELETTNEELQSTNEELETTNEELHSTNEELETMNEELQSTNEELQTINEEVRRHSAEDGRLNTFLTAILGSLRGGVVVLDETLQVQVWNRQSEEWWGLRAEEVRNRQFLLLDIGLPVEQLRQPIRDCLAQRQDGEPQDREDLVLAARNRRGKDFCCRVSCTPLVGPEGETQGIVLLMEDQAGV